ncbi:MAG: hypothetical protein WKF70_14115 [Chitinophagaceae bacterium]
MQTEVYKGSKIVTCINCITGKTEELIFQNGRLKDINETKATASTSLFIGTGLIDLQVNGINGIDFNNPSLTQEDIVKATHYLLGEGITKFLPTVITNSDDNILQLLNTIYQACLADSLVNDCICGIHLEGPFISSSAGAKGAHDERYIKLPDWALFKRFQEAAGGKIKLITLAPELEGSRPFIKKCKDQGILVSIGHSMANSEQINEAVAAGASLSTHLGNAVPLLLPRHPNLIWDQLAAEDLYACIITDGIHIPDSFIKVVIKTKGSATILVSDATCFTGMPPGEYESHIGGTVILDHEKRISLKRSPGLLAGAATTLLENIGYLIAKNISTLAESWQMASTNVEKLLAQNDAGFDHQNDKVLFHLIGKEIQIESVIKNGTVVFER